jgi:hypothetical protein
VNLLFLWAPYVQLADPQLRNASLDYLYSERLMFSETNALFMNTSTVARSLVCTGKKSSSNLAGHMLSCFKISAVLISFPMRLLRQHIIARQVCFLLHYSISDHARSSWSHGELNNFFSRYTVVNISAVTCVLCSIL